ncbi:MAG TPA: molybdopterin-dependent oxidoreductase [Acidimicrobiales bacterium]|nr:molybdopterin-dependent oxidoreductase [Acidimicrobiales bacterium]
MSSSGSVRVTPTATHWGNYDVETLDGRVVALRPSATDPDPSPIGTSMAGAQDDAVRLRRPMVRKGWLDDGPAPAHGRRGREGYVEVGWDELFDLVARELARVKGRYGNEAIYAGSYGWGSAGRFHHPQSQVHRFLALHGGYTGSVNTYSHAALEVLLPHVIGGAPTSIFTRMPLWDEVADHGELVVAFGGLGLKNGQVNHGGVGRHGSRDAQRAASGAGVRFVNVSPLRDDTAELLHARWIAPRPNTDTALMLGICHTLLVEERCDEDFLTRCCHGWDVLRGYLLGEADATIRDAHWAASICGVDAGTIEELAREIASHRTLIAVSWSLQRAHHGEQAYWAAVALAAMSGSMGKPGGGFGAGYGTEDAVGRSGYRWPIAALPQPPNPVATFIPVARVADMLLGPGAEIDYDGRRLRYPDIKLVYWCGGNPFHHHQDLHRLARAWQRPETVIVHDAWWTPTVRMADIVVPVATSLERDDFAASPLDNWLSAVRKAAEPPAGIRTDYEVFAAVAERLGFVKDFTEGRTSAAWVRQLYDVTRGQLARDGVEIPDFDGFWQEGRVELPVRKVEPAGSFTALRADPDAAPLDTPSGRVELYSEVIAGFGYDDCPGHPSWLEPAEWLGSPLAGRFPLHLVSNQPSTRLHSQYDNGDVSKASKIQGREPLRMHPADAAARAIEEGDVVRVFNDRGACLAGVVVSDAVREGVVQIATGAWFDPVSPGEPGSLDRHGNPNVLTIDTGTSRLAQGPAALTALVEVELAPEGERPQVEVFGPPPVETGRAARTDSAPPAVERRG